MRGPSALFSPCVHASGSEAKKQRLYAKIARMRHVFRHLTVSAVLFSIAFPSSLFAQAAQINTSDALAEGFDPNVVLSDDDIFNLNDMPKPSMDAFLHSRGTLGSAKQRDIDGVEKPVSDILWRVATSYKMNPKYLLALIQKEQSLVEDPNPSQKQFDWATGFGICDSCSLTDPSLLEFKGFASQVEWAAKQHREKYLLQILGRGATLTGLAPGKTTMIDGTKVTPANQATAMLYTYTPHLKGNLNLWKIWQRWFSLAFPDGTVVRTREDQQTYLIRLGMKRRFKNHAVATSMVDPKKIVMASHRDLSSYADGRDIAFPNYALVETPEHDRYLLVGDTKRKIASLKVFRRLGLNEDEVIDASAADVDAYTDAPDLTAGTQYPIGLLVRDAKKQLWHVEDGVKHLIPHRAFLSLYFAGQPVRMLPARAMNALTLGTPYVLRDGELVQIKGEKGVAVIENGNRRPIPNADVFVGLGWKWNNVVTLPASLLNNYPLGEPVASYKHTLLAAKNIDEPENL